MRNLLTEALLLIFSIVVLCLPSNVTAKEDLQQFINDISQKVISINTYRAKLNTTIYPSCVPINSLRRDQEREKDDSVYSNTVVTGETGKRMKIETVIHEKESNINIRYGLTFDGTWLWIEQETEIPTTNGNNQNSLSATKVRIAEVSPNPEKEPFNALFFVNGTGLWPYRDLPGTFRTILNSYVFNKISGSPADGKLIVTGLRKEKIDSHEGVMSARELFCHLMVREEDFLITSITYGSEEDSVCMNTDIEYVEINNELPKNVFTYNSQEGVPVRDITSHIKAKNEKMNEKSHKRK